MRKRNVLVWLMATSMTAAVLGGCGQAESQESGEAVSSEAATESASDEALLEGGAYKCSDEPLTLTAHIHWNDRYVLTDDMIIPKEAAKYTNITLEGTASSMDSDSTQSFNLMITSQELPDLVGGNRQDILKYGMEGAFIPLNDLIDEYAPDIKKILDENPDVKGAITAEDGNIYQIPFMFSDLVSEAYFIRQDWLDKVGMEIPTTVDELHDVLKAFLDQDANGNGERDEIGYFSRVSVVDENKLEGLLPLFGINDYWHLNKEGKVAIGLYTPEYKEAIKQVSQWYAEGLIDPEVFTRGGNARDILFPENNGGLIHDWIPSTSGYNKTVPEKVPGFKLVGMLPPTDINGDQWEFASRDKLTGAGWAISSQNEHPVESIKYMNFWFTETGRRLKTYGVEGVTYNMVDGKPVYTDEILNSDQAINVQIMDMGGMLEDMAYLHDASYEEFAMDEEGKKTLEMYEEAGVVNKCYPRLPALSFTDEENDLILAKYPACRTYMLEQLQKWTFDGSTIDQEFDGYMETLKNMGMDEVVAAYQAAYDRLMSVE